jgi:hypothetical protein
MASSFYDPANQTKDSITGGERVRVAMRVRPMMPHEEKRNDRSIMSVPDAQHVHLNLKTGAKQFRFNAVLPDITS